MLCLLAYTLSGDYNGEVIPGAHGQSDDDLEKSVLLVPEVCYLQFGVPEVCYLQFGHVLLTNFTLLMQVLP